MLHTILPSGEEVVRLAAVSEQHRFQVKARELAHNGAIWNAASRSVQSHLKIFKYTMCKSSVSSG
jgi:hypothetical protein